MCASCGCGKPNDDHGDSRDSMMKDLDQAAQAAGTTPERVAENRKQRSQPSRGQDTGSTSTEQAEYQQNSLVKESGRKPGERSPNLGQDSGSAYQEGLQMGETGRGGVENPQTNP